jgi:formylglycine-generating enzyme required for sulfatase activity
MRKHWQVRLRALLWVGILWWPLSNSPVANAEDKPPGSTIQDCDKCPKLVVVPTGSFLMGDLADRGLPNEKPVHRVTISRSFAVGLTEITYAQWDECVTEGGCRYSPSDDNLGRGNRAVGKVNVADVKEYLNWLSKKSGRRYRLLTEAEWEYVTRAGTKTAYPWGEEFGTGHAVCASCKVGSVVSIEVAKVPPNKFGLYDTIGSRHEWVQDCWNNNYDGAPTNGSAWAKGDCSRHVIRGGSYYEPAKFLRSATRFGMVVQTRNKKVGFRVARDLE